MRDPVLATRTIPGLDYGRNVNGTLTAKGGLHYIKGNPLPYFSLTADIHRKGFPDHFWAGGCCHDEILRYWAKFADLVALHLCDMYGAPMHAVKNGLYNIAGALGGLGQQYHVGNSDRSFPCTPPADRPWAKTEYRKPTPLECRIIARDHFRCTDAELDALILDLTKSPDHKAVIGAFVDTLRPRWKEEARACVEAHGLVIYGDLQAWELKKSGDEVAAKFAETLDRLANVTSPGLP